MLKPVRDIFKEVLGQTRPKTPAMLKLLKEAGIDEPVMIERKSYGPKAYAEPYLDAEPFTFFTTWLTAWKEAQAKPKPKNDDVKLQLVPATEAFKPLIEAFERRTADLEELYLETRAEVDTLHKAVEAMTQTYTRLMQEVDPIKARDLPPAPSLPPRYKYKVLIIGGDTRFLERLRQTFPMVKILHLESGGNASGGKKGSSKEAFPRADFILLLKNFIPHPLQDKAIKFYGRENLQVIGGATSSIESAIHVWLHERQKQDSPQ